MTWTVETTYTDGTLHVHEAPDEASAREAWEKASANLEVGVVCQLKDPAGILIDFELGGDPTGKRGTPEAGNG